MAGNAALAAGKPDMALGLLDQAAQDAGGGEDRATTGDIALDRARALVALKRLPEAVSALVEARAATPNNAQAWLLSATLSRRMGKLADAQAQIATAAELLPVDPEIGLEAGVIAVLSGRDEAARKSWESVVKAAPGSAQAESAKVYLAQLGGKK
jgi:Flp pilus assembly protein TadD